MLTLDAPRDNRVSMHNDDESTVPCHGFAATIHTVAARACGRVNASRRALAAPQVLPVNVVAPYLLTALIEEPREACVWPLLLGRVAGQAEPSIFPAVDGAGGLAPPGKRGRFSDGDTRPTLKASMYPQLATGTLRDFRRQRMSFCG